MLRNQDPKPTDILKLQGSIMSQVLVESNATPMSKLKQQWMPRHFSLLTHDTAAKDVEGRTTPEQPSEAKKKNPSKMHEL